MEKNIKIGKMNLPDKNLGFIFWQLEEIENYYPCYKTIIKK